MKSFNLEHLSKQNLKDTDIEKLILDLNNHFEITTLNLSKNKITAKGAEILATATHLTALDLSHNEIGNEGAKALATNTKLTSLKLKDCGILSPGAKALARNTSLTKLNLADNDIYDDGAKEFAFNTTLKSLNLNHTQIGDQGAKALGGYRHSLLNSSSGEKKIISLVIHPNPYEGYPTHYDIDIEFTDGTKIKENLNAYEIVKKYGEKYPNYLCETQNKHILYGTNVQTSVRKEILQANKTFSTIPRFLASQPTLTSLNLSLNRISDEGAKALATNANLTSLKLASTDITGECAQTFAQNKNLISLYLSFNKIDDKGGEELATNATLTSLDLENNNVGDAGAKAFAMNKTLTFLGLEDNKISDIGAIEFMNNRTLTFLGLEGNKINSNLNNDIATVITANKKSSSLTNFSLFTLTEKSVNPHVTCKPSNNNQSTY